MLLPIKNALKDTSVRSILILSLLFFFVSNLISAFVLFHFPNSGDEYAYYFQAHIFASGRLFAPSPPSKQLLTNWMIIDDGKWYILFQPGWPAFLSIGVLAGVPWIVNPIFSTITLIILYFISKELYNENIALKATILLVASPFFLLNAASFFAHPNALFFASLFVYFFLKAIKTEHSARYHVFGMICLTIIAYNRIYTAFLFFIPYLGYVIGTRKFKILLFALIAGTGALIPMFLYNTLLHGHPLVFGYQFYDPNDRPGFYVHGYTPGMVPGKALLFVSEFCIFFPAIILVPLFLFQRDFYETKENIFLLSIFISVFIGYLLYFDKGGDRFGPRFLYETLSCITPLCAGGINSLQRFQKPGKWLKNPLPLALLVLLILANIGSFIDRSVYYSNYISDRKTVYDIVEQKTPVNSIIFIANDNLPPPFYAAFFCRNDPFLKGRIYAPHTTFKDDLSLASKFPDRTPFVYYHNTGEVIQLFSAAQTDEAPTNISYLYVESAVNATWTNFHYYELEEGSIFKITWKLTNVGSSALKNVKVSLVVPQGLQLLSENATYVNELTPSDVVEVEYVLKATQAHFWNFELGYDKRPIAYRIKLRIEGQDIGNIGGKDYVRIHVRLSRTLVIGFSFALILVFLVTILYLLFTYRSLVDRVHLNTFLMGMGFQGTAIFVSVVPIWLFLEHEFPLQFVLWLCLIGGLLYLSFSHSSSLLDLKDSN